MRAGVEERIEDFVKVRVEDGAICRICRKYGWTEDNVSGGGEKRHDPWWHQDRENSNRQ